MSLAVSTHKVSSCQEPPFAKYHLAAGYSGAFAVPSVVSGAQRTIKDLEQLSTASADAIVESIEEAMQEAEQAEAGTGMAEPVLSKNQEPQGRADIWLKSHMVGKLGPCLSF